MSLLTERVERDSGLVASCGAVVVAFILILTALLVVTARGLPDDARARASEPAAAPLSGSRTCADC